MLVIAPLKACYRVWPAEVEKWLDFNHLRWTILHGSEKQAYLDYDADVFIINPEGLEWLIYGGRGDKARGYVDIRYWRSLGFDTLVVDELTKFKHASGIRFKALKRVLHTFSRRWGLTGSFGASGYEDLFGQVYVLDLGNALGQYITHYRAAYFDADENGWNHRLRPGAQSLIDERLKPLALRMEDKEYLDLPPIIDVPVKLDLPDKIRAVYDQLEEDLIAKIDARVVTAANAATAGGKLWQVCNGGLYVDNDVMSILGGKERTTLALHNEKTDWLEELINELNGQPLLVAYQFQHDLERLRARFGNDIPVFGANQTANEEIELAWNRNDLPYVFGQQDSIAHALNLQGGSAAHLAHYSMTWNLETYDQLIRRIRRSGTQAKRVFRYLPLMRNTTDEDRMYSLNRKDKTQRSLYEALKARHGRK